MAIRTNFFLQIVFLLQIVIPSEARDLGFDCSRSEVSGRHGALCDLRRKAKRLRLIPLARQIIPLGIRRFNQRQTLRTSPSFDLLLTLDRVANVFEALEVNQSGDVVFRCKAGSQFQFVLPHAAAKAVSHAGVNSLSGISHDVNEVAPLFAHSKPPPKLSSRAQRGTLVSAYSTSHRRSEQEPRSRASLGMRSRIKFSASPPPAPSLAPGQRSAWL